MKVILIENLSIMNIRIRTLSAAAVLSICFVSIALGSYSGGTGEPNSPYQIADANDLLELAADTNNYNKCFILTADINMAGQVFTTAIIAADISSSYLFQGTAFTGVFDGNSHKIANFTISGGGNEYLGLFGYVDSGGTVKNLGLENFSVSCSDSQYLGGLVGDNDGSISNCYSTGAVSSGDTSSSIGGLAGLNTGSINNSYSTGSVSGSSGSNRIGGLVGNNYFYASISNCYSTGEVNGSNYVGGLVGSNLAYSSISYSYSIGTVSGSLSVGGLVGDNSETITSCYFLDTSGPNNGFGTPLTDEEMKQQDSFIGWDFVCETADGTEDIWRMCIDEVHYPLLWWQFNTADFTCPDGVDFIDFATLANAWLSDSTQLNWNGRCDIAEPPDNVIDVLDLAIFAENWLEGL